MPTVCSLPEKKTNTLETHTAQNSKPATTDMQIQSKAVMLVQMVGAFITLCAPCWNITVWCGHPV